MHSPQALASSCDTLEVWQGDGTSTEVITLTLKTELCVNQKKKVLSSVLLLTSQSRKMDWTTQTPRTQEESYVAVLGLVYKLSYPSDGFCSLK